MTLRLQRDTVGLLVEIGVGAGGLADLVQQHRYIE